MMVLSRRVSDLQPVGCGLVGVSGSPLLPWERSGRGPGVVPVDVRATSAVGLLLDGLLVGAVRNRSASSSLMPCLAATGGEVPRGRLRRRLGVRRSLLRLLEVGEVGGGDVVELLLQRGGVLLGRGAGFALGLERLLAVLAQRLVGGAAESLCVASGRPCRRAWRRQRWWWCRTCVLPRGVDPSTSRRREVLADVAGGDEPLDGVVTGCGEA
jgi:hypothetical protein